MTAAVIRSYRPIFLAAIAEAGIQSPVPIHRIEAYYIYHFVEDQPPETLGGLTWNTVKAMMPNLVEFVSEQPPMGRDGLQKIDQRDQWDAIASENVIPEAWVAPESHPALTDVAEDETLMALAERIHKWKRRHRERES